MKKLFLLVFLILPSIFYSQKLTEISPNSGNAGQTLQLTITGTNTHFDQGSGTVVKFGFNQGSGTTIINSMNVVSPTTISVNITIPQNAITGDYNISTFNNFDGTLLLAKSFHINGQTPPSLSSVTSNSGNAGQTLQLTITGANTHFNQGSGTVVKFGFSQGSSTIVNSFNVVNATSLNANVTIPQNVFTGDYDVSVYNSVDGLITLPNGFHVNGTPAPSIVSTSVNTGTAGQTLQLTITGVNTHFNQGSGTTLRFGFNQGSGTTVVNSISALNSTTLSANITIPQNTATGDYDILLYNSIDKLINLKKGFHVIGNSTLSGYVLSKNENQPGNCDGQAKVIVHGGELPYTYYYSNGEINSEVNGLCPGIYSVKVIDAKLDTLNIDFIISSLLNTYVNYSLPDSLVVDSLASSVISNCVIDYSQISNVNILNYTFLPNNEVSVTWRVAYNGKTEDIIQKYKFGVNAGVYVVALQLYCPHKSTGQYLTSYDKLYYNSSWAGISEIEKSAIKIYPNPFNDYLNVDTDNEDNTEIIITDIAGKEVANRKFNDKLIKIDMNTLSSGSYIITVRNNNTVFTKQIVK